MDQPIERDGLGHFKPGFGGRRRGSKHKIARVLKDAIYPGGG